MTVLTVSTAVFVTSLLLTLRSASEAEPTDFETMRTSTCLTSQDEYLTLTCVQGQMVRLVRAFLGHSTAGTCRYLEGDCTMDMPSSDNDDCTGTSVCRITVQSSHFGKLIPKCRQPGTYVQALYQCIPESSSLSVCDNSPNFVVGQRGFLRTPGYPNNYANDLDCNFTLIAPHEDQRFMLFVIDLDLEPKGTGCSDWLQVFDGFQSITLCSQRTRYWLRNSTQRTFHIRMYSDSRNTERGFWLYYEAFPFLPLTDLVTSINPSTQPQFHSSTATHRPPRLLSIFDASFHRTETDSRTIPLSSPPPPSSSTSSSSSSSQTASPSVAVSNQLVYVTSDGQSLPLTVLMAIVVTLIACVLVILLVIVVIKSRSVTPSPARTPSSSDRVDNLERERRVLQSTPQSSFLKSPLGRRGLRNPHEDALIPPPSPTELMSTPVEAFRDVYDKHNNC